MRVDRDLDQSEGASVAGEILAAPRSPEAGHPQPANITPVSRGPRAHHFWQLDTQPRAVKADDWVMGNERDRSRARDHGHHGTSAIPSRAGAGNTAARIYRRVRSSSDPARIAPTEVPDRLPFMDVMIDHAARVQRREEPGAAAATDLSDTAALAIASHGTSGPTASLPHADKMHAAFDGVIDLSSISVHGGEKAAQASAQLGAQAYTVGSTVALPDGADAFTTAHELAHVAQGRRGKVQPRGVSSPDDADERQADAVAARVVAGEPIGDLLGTPTGSVAVKRQAAPGPAAAPDAGAASPPEVTREDLDKILLVEAYKDIVASEFGAMLHGVRRTIDELEKRTPKKPDLLASLVNMAAGAAIAGAAGVVAEVVARKLSSYVAEGYAAYKQVHQRFATDSLKEQLKKSFRVGSSAVKGDIMGELRLSLWDAQFKKIQAAKTDFFASFGDHTGREMAALPLDVLRAAIARAHQSANDPEIADAASRNTAVEWANLVAQLHHGDGSWDPWAGPRGSAHAHPPLFGGGGPQDSKDPENHPSNNNVAPDSDSIRDLVDDDQRSMNPGSNGILEIDLWGYGVDEHGRFGEFELFTRSGFGMRLGGVSSYVKRMVAEFSTVRDLKMNKIVTLYSSRGDRVSPPKPEGRFLITADEYVRRWTTDGGELELSAAAEFAQSLSPRSVQ